MHLEACDVCPRRCYVNREVGETGFCGSTSEMRIARAALHFWEEPPISGERGSGTVFFTGCSLRCLFCQNHEISTAQNTGRTVSPRELSEIFFKLIDEGAHNINLVTPTHFAPLIKKALLIKKLPVPVVYNSSGYERVETLRELEGLIDIYLPDIKYADRELAKKLSRTEDYLETALAAVKEMVRQTGAPVYDECGIMQRGVLIRHLILPLHTQNTIDVLKLIKKELPDIPVSLMAQYTPCGPAAQTGGIPDFPELSRSITKRELNKAEAFMLELGLDGFVQSRAARGSEYIPDFHQFENT